MSSPSAVAGSTPRVDPVMLRVWALVAGGALVTVTLLLTTLRDVPAYLDTVPVPWVALDRGFRPVVLGQHPLRGPTAVTNGPADANSLGRRAVLRCAGRGGAPPARLLVRALRPRRSRCIKRAFNLSVGNAEHRSRRRSASTCWRRPRGDHRRSARGRRHSQRDHRGVVSAAAVVAVIGLVEGGGGLGRTVLGVLPFSLVANVVVTSLALVAVASLTASQPTQRCWRSAAALLLLACRPPPADPAARGVATALPFAGASGRWRTAATTWGRRLKRFGSCSTPSSRALPGGRRGRTHANRGL